MNSFHFTLLSSSIRSNSSSKICTLFQYYFTQNSICHLETIPIFWFSNVGLLLLFKFDTYIYWSSNHLFFKNFFQGQIPTPNPPFASNTRISLNAFNKITPIWSYYSPVIFLCNIAEVFLPLKSKMSPVSAIYWNYFCVMYYFFNS